MLSVIKSYALEGIDGYPIDIEVDTQGGIPAFDIVGLPSSTVKESRNRVRSAIKNSSFDFVPKRVTVNLAPADTKKEGSLYDFPIAIGFLASTGQIPLAKISDFIMIGELSLDGSLRKVNGVMPILISALQNGYKKFIIPFENAKEASYIINVEVYAIKSLSEATSFLGNILDIARVQPNHYESSRIKNKYDVDLSEVRGQVMAKRALEIAVSGAHNMLMCGSPGAGKSMLAKCVASIMPDLTFDEAIETTKIHSIAGLIDNNAGMITARPFRSPHHTASLYSLTGGGAKSTPGEVSLAHNGVLFLDEMPEYSQKTLETLRQPLEDGVITVSRVARSVEYPARFMLIASMNPCPCGYEGSRIKECTCTAQEKRRYKARISGPLLDRIDIYVEVDGIEYTELRNGQMAETSEAVKKRVTMARGIQLARLANDGIYTNSQMSNTLLKKYCPLDKDSEQLLELAFKRYRLSARGAMRIIKLARTIADLRAAKDIAVQDIAEAIQFRTRGVGND